MPYERKPNTEDPEVAAEREYNRLNGIKTDPVDKMVESLDKLDANGVSKGVPISPASSDSGNVSTASSLHKSGSFKELKCERKKRSRGVSGSSIKKDGGRFDMGLDSYEDDYYDRSDEEEFFPQPVELEECFDSDEDLDRVQTLYATITQHFDAHTIPEPSEFATRNKLRMLELHTALCAVVEDDLKKDCSPWRIVSDNCGEYRIAVMLAPTLKAFYTSSVDIDEDLRLAGIPDMEATPALVTSLLKAAWSFVEYDTEELRGELNGCPDEAIDDAANAMISGAFDEQLYRERIEPLDLFHVEIVKRAITKAVNSFDLNCIKNTAKSVHEFAKLSGPKFDSTYRLALDRIAAQQDALFIQNTLAFPNILRLFIAEVVESEQLWPYYAGPGRNWTRIPKSVVTIAICKEKPNEILVLHETPKNNIMLLKHL